MSNRYTPPETYQQWLECFEHLKGYTLDEKMLESMAQGTFLGKPTESFLSRLSDVVSMCMSGYCQRFLRMLDLALSEGEPDMAGILASRLKKDIQRCFFYRSLTFLDESFVQKLDQGFREQLEQFWGNFLNQLRKSARDSDWPVMEDLYYEMKRVTILR